MHIRLFSMLMFTVTISCGFYDRDKSKETDSDNENSAEASPPTSSVVSGPAGPAGTDGRNGINGQDGAHGPKGETGPQGAAGPAGGITLYESNGKSVGSKFNEEAGGIAHVITPDHVQVKIDRYSGQIAPPSDNLFCLYQSADCSGTCYVYDRRWLDFLVIGADGKIWVADRATENTGAMAMESYVDGAGACQGATITTIESFVAREYNSSAISLPFSAPLYWDLAR